MPKLRNSLLTLLIAGLCLAQTGDMVPPEVRRVGDRLACLCESCKNTVATCQMLGCHYTAPARARITELTRQGVSDDAIVQEFVQRNGKQALAVPPAEGFQLMVYIMPPVMAIAGLGLVGWFIRRHRQPAAAKPNELDEKDIEKYQKAAGKEMEKFDE
jgi:cytochrome c-type biogenesis protein CcmH/NrfF